MKWSAEKNTVKTPVKKKQYGKFLIVLIQYIVPCFYDFFYLCLRVLQFLHIATASEYSDFSLYIFAINIPFKAYSKTW